MTASNGKDMNENERKTKDEREAYINAIIKRLGEATLSDLRVVYGYLIA